MLSVDHVSKTFVDARGRGDVHVLQDVCFEIAEGECVSIIGPSGCGKTTLLRIIHGLEPATRGSVAVRGVRVVEPALSRAMVFQHFNLLPWLTAAENIAFGLEVAGRPAHDCAERVARLVALVGLEGFANRYPHELSGGMQQRVGLARALAVEPALLLLDEPFGAVDAITREQLQREVATLLAGRQTTAVFITHSMDEALFFSDRVLVMCGRPSRIVDDVRVTLGRPREAGIMRADRQFAELREHLWALLSAGARA